MPQLAKYCSMAAPVRAISSGGIWRWHCSNNCRSSVRMCWESVSRKGLQIRNVQPPGLCLREEASQRFMFGEQLLDQRWSVFLRRREQHLLFSREVEADLALPGAGNFFLPGVEFGIAVSESAVETYAHRQRVLVLTRKRDKVLVAQHACIIHPRRGLTLGVHCPANDAIA